VVGVPPVSVTLCGEIAWGQIAVVQTTVVPWLIATCMVSGATFQTQEDAVVLSARVIVTGLPTRLVDEEGVAVTAVGEQLPSGFTAGVTEPLSDGLVVVLAPVESGADGEVDGCVEVAPAEGVGVPEPVPVAVGDEPPQPRSSSAITTIRTTAAVATRARRRQ